MSEDALLITIQNRSTNRIIPIDLFGDSFRFNLRSITYSEKYNFIFIRTSGGSYKRPGESMTAIDIDQNKELDFDFMIGHFSDVKIINNGETLFYNRHNDDYRSTTIGTIEIPIKKHCRDFKREIRM